MRLASSCRKAAKASGSLQQDLGALRFDRVPYFRRVQRAGDGGMQLADDLARGLGRRRDSVPGAHREIAIARLGHGRRFGQRLGARRAGDGERAQLAAPHLRQHRRDVEEREVDLAADQIGCGGCAALVGHLDQLHVGAQLQQHAEKLRNAADPDRGECHVAGRVAGGGDELRHALVGAARRHDQDVGNVGDGGDRRKRRDAIVAGVLHQRRRDHVRRRAADEKRVAVGLGLRHRAGTDGGARARAVVDDDRAAERLAHPLGDRPREQVGRAAGGIRVDQRDRPGGKGLGERASRRRGHGEQNRQCETLHAFLPRRSRGGVRAAHLTGAVPASRFCDLG